MNDGDLYQYYFKMNPIWLNIKLISDFILEISDEKNDKLVIKPTLPQGKEHGPHHTHGVSVAEFTD